MDAVIIDTNVMVVANGRSAAPQASEKCVALCRKRLREILQGPEIILLDDKKRIIKEYRNNLNEKGRSFGDRFWLELKRRLYNPKSYPNTVLTVGIRPLAGNGTEFEEFPNDDTGLENFHKKDKKFVAVAIAYQTNHEKDSPIQKAEDSGWEKYKATLESHGVQVYAICDDES